ncbi:MAG TPA: SIR2 family protein [Candidatus Angelobacter sp.]
MASSPVTQETANVPYEIIWGAWKRGQVIPFLGAGASFVGRPAGAKFNPRDPKFLPSGWDLSAYLATASNFPAKEDWERGDLAKVCSYYVEVQGDREELRYHLRDLLNRSYQPGPLHHFIAGIPSSQVIVVTNYDTLLEQAFLKAGKPYDLVVYPADRPDFANALLWWPHGATEPTPVEANKLDIDLTKTTVIYKMHGTIDPRTDEWDNFVITEEDYVEFLSRMTRSAAVPSSFIEYFRNRRFLFLGYSLRDWNLRVVLNSLKRGSSASQEGKRSWSVQLNPSELERTLWKNKNVTIYDLTLDEFTAAIEQTRRAIGD